MPLLKGRYEVTMKGEGRPAAAEVVGPGGALQTEILRSECAVLLFPYYCVQHLSLRHAQTMQTKGK